MKSTTEDIIHRWSSFVSKIGARFHESQQQALQACKDLLIESDYDYHTTIRSWTGIKAQIYQLSSKVDQVWDTQVKYTDAEHKVPAHLHPGEITDAMHLRLDEFQRDLEAELSEMFYAHAIRTANNKFQCTQCHSPLRIHDKVFRPHYVTCNYCQSVNTFTPDDKYRQIGWNIVDNIAEKQTRALYNKMQNALHAIENQRPPVEEHYWDTYIQAYEEYYKAYYSARARMNEAAEKRLEKDLERKRKELQNYLDIHRKVINS